MYGDRKSIMLAEYNLDIVIDCLCNQITQQQITIEAQEAARKRLETEMRALRDKYEKPVAEDFDDE